MDLSSEKALALVGLGDALLADGDARGAEQSFARAVATLRKEPETEVDLAAALVGVGRAALALGRPADAIAPLEEALAGEATAEEHAGARFALARALWDARRDRGRARALATEAEAAYAGPRLEAKRAAVRAWLASRAP